MRGLRGLGRWDNVRENVVKLLLIFVNYKFETKCVWGVEEWERVGAHGRDGGAERGVAKGFVKVLFLQSLMKP